MPRGFLLFLMTAQCSKAYCRHHCLILIVLIVLLSPHQLFSFKKNFSLFDAGQGSASEEEQRQGLLSSLRGPGQARSGQVRPGQCNM